MTKKKFVTREQILEAIKTEPLTSGYWVQYRNDEDGIYGINLDPNCPVCAIGGVLRKSGLSNEEIDHFGNKMGNYGPISARDFRLEREVVEMTTNFLKKKQYLHALSLKFEHLAEQGIGSITRKKLAKFVRDNFPAKVELNPRK